MYLPDLFGTNPGEGFKDVPVTQGPVCMPIRSRSLSWGLCRILKLVNTALRRSKAMLATSSTWRPPFLVGRPLTTMYASPIVSTYKEQILKFSACKWYIQIRVRSRWLANTVRNIALLTKIRLWCQCISLEIFSASIWLLQILFNGRLEIKRRLSDSGFIFYWS